MIYKEKINSNQKSNTFNKQWLTYLILIDILFFPYFPLFVIPMSLPIVMSMIIFRYNFNIDKYFKAFLIIMILVMVSVFVSFLVGQSSEYLIENIKRAFQFTSSFAYFFYFKDYKIVKDENIKKILIAFIVYQFILGLIFFENPEFIVILKESFYGNSVETSTRILYFNRYNYMFTDPNTAAYFFLIVVFYLLGSFKLKNLTQYSIIFITIVLLLAFKSTGAALIFIAGILLVAVKQDLLNFRVFRNILFFIIMGIIIIFLITERNPVLWSKIVDNFEGFKQRSEYRSANYSDNGRISIYLEAVKTFIPFIWGQGYSLLIDNNLFKPHSDHLRLIYSYGVITYITIMWFFFKNLIKDNFLFLLPAFMAFTINTLIDEQKLLVLFLCFLAIEINLSSQYKLKQNNSYI